jgi:AbiV family abortive infection protein
MKKSSYWIINELTEISSEKLKGFKDQNEFAETLKHIENLIENSFLLFRNKFFSQSLFLTITAFEEISKTEVCIFRGFSEKPNVKRSKDGLFNHKTKHLIASNEIFFKYTKAEKLFGKEKILEIQKKLENGNFIKLREESLYFESTKNGVKLPNKIITELDSRLTLFLCIELFEDRFLGLSKDADLISNRMTRKLDTLM